MDTRQDWDARADAYVRQVEVELSRVDHPRRAQVLQDVRAHLDEIYADIDEGERTPEAFAQAIERMGPPEEYAELLADGQFTGSRRSRRRRFVIGFVTVLVLLTAYFFLWTNPAGRSITLRLLGLNWSATPFFSKGGFAGLEPGMTIGEVRDAIGYPLWRHAWVGREDEVLWKYTTVPFDSAPSYTEYIVVFSRTSRKVLRTKTVTVHTGGETDRPEWISTASGSFTLKAGKRRKELRTSDTQPYLLVRYSGGYSSVAYAVENVAKRARRLTESLPPESIEVLNLYTEGRPHFSEHVSELFKVISPPLPENASYYGAVYKSGRFYFLPPIYSGAEEELWREDQEWLVRRLVLGS